MNLECICGMNDVTHDPALHCLGCAEVQRLRECTEMFVSGHIWSRSRDESSVRVTGLSR